MLLLQKKVNLKRKKSTGRMPYSWKHAELICWLWGGFASSNAKPDLPIFIVSWHSNNAFLSLDGITVDHCLGDLETKKFPLTSKRRPSKIYTFIQIHPLKYPQALAAHGHQTDLKETPWPWCDLFIGQVPIPDSVFLQFCVSLPVLSVSSLSRLQ